MSERSLSPADYFELKHVKSITNKQFRKGRTILFKTEMIDEQQKCNLSCACSECGQMIGFSLGLRSNLQMKETRQQKKKRVLKRFKAIGNAIIFILTYKMEAIKRLKKKMHLLRAVRNLTTVRRPAAVLQSVHLLPVVLPTKQPINHEEDVEESLSIQPFQMYQKGPRKSQISLYMEKMLRHVEPKNETNLQPLSIFNNAINKSKRKIHLKSLSQQLSITQFNYQTQLTPYCELNRTTTNNSYHNNNKDILKLIDLMKVKHRVIRIKK